MPPAVKEFDLLTQPQFFQDTLTDTMFESVKSIGNAKDLAGVTSEEFVRLKSGYGLGKWDPKPLFNLVLSVMKAKAGTPYGIKNLDKAAKQINGFYGIARETMTAAHNHFKLGSVKLRE